MATPSPAPAPKKFDGMTFVGLAVALLILYFGWQHQLQRSREDAARLNTPVEQPQPRAKPEKSDGAPTPARSTGLAVVGGSETDPITPITVTTSGLELQFSSHGAVLVSARLLNVYEDALKKDVKGLDILAEIVEGKCAFGIPKFQIWPDGKSQTSNDPLLIDGEPGDSLDTYRWKETDTGNFDATTGNRTITYELAIKSYKLTKTFTISNKDEFVRCDLQVENGTNSAEVYFYWLNGPQGILMDDSKISALRTGRRVLIQCQMAGRDSAAKGQSNAEPEVTQPIYADMKKTEKDEGRFISHNENLWGTVKNRFFMATLVSLDPQQVLSIITTPIQYVDTHGIDKHPGDDRYRDPNLGIVVYRRDFTLVGKTGGGKPNRTDSYALYLGPADDRHLMMAEAAIKQQMETPTDYHLNLSARYLEWKIWRTLYVDELANGMMWLFRGLYRLFGNFGVAVVLMTLIIKLCLHPLSRKQMKSMFKMQKLAPELNKIKEKYKNATGTEAKMKMANEQQDVMKKAGVNPAAGCLPMFIQIPIFSALYGIFYHAFEMRGAQFLWIKDLSQPDQLFTITALQGTTNWFLSWLPTAINLLPILYTVLSIIQTRMTPQQKSEDPQQEMNRKMMMFMPIMISFMFYSMPAGLVLYFTVSALWGMLESWYIKKFILKSTGTPETPSLNDSKTLKKAAKA